jgi:hypothetical protein
MGWVWPSILVPIGIFTIGIIWLSIVITGDALGTWNKNKQ